MLHVFQLLDNEGNRFSNKNTGFNSDKLTITSFDDITRLTASQGHSHYSKKLFGKAMSLNFELVDEMFVRTER
jgi:hypothetical protein